MGDPIPLFFSVCKKKLNNNFANHLFPIWPYLFVIMEITIFYDLLIVYKSC